MFYYLVYHQLVFALLQIDRTIEGWPNNGVEAALFEKDHLTPEW